MILRPCALALLLAACGQGRAVKCDRLDVGDAQSLGDPGVGIEGPFWVERAEQGLALRASADRPDQIPLYDPEYGEAWTLARTADPVSCPTRPIAAVTCADGEAVVQLGPASGCDEEDGPAWISLRHRPGVLRGLTVEPPVGDSDTDR